MAGLLVTGGAGFIGSAFVRYRRRHAPAEPIVVLDALTYAGDTANILDIGELDFVNGDIRDTGLVCRLLVDHRLDTIVNFAAESHVDRSILGPSAFVETNILGTHSLIEAARAVWLDTGSGGPHCFHQISTDEVYGSLAPDGPPSREGDAYRPSSPYAASKAAADHLVRAAHRTYGLQTRVTICPNNYGPRQYPEKLVPLFIANILLGRPLPIYGDGLNRRDWLHVDDHVAGLSLALEQGAAGETYHLRGGAELSNLELIDLLCRAVDALFAERPQLARAYPDAQPSRGLASDSLKRFVADRSGHDRRYALDGGKAAGALGFAAARPLHAGLTETLRWYAANPGWWRRKLPA
jgi:dTDP-glucose 4,6-dehydratase